MLFAEGNCQYRDSYLIQVLGVTIGCLALNTTPISALQGSRTIKEEGGRMNVREPEDEEACHAALPSSMTWLLH